MRICFYSPYIPEHFGGGEKHLLDVASAAAKLHRVEIAVSSKTQAENLDQIKKEYRTFFGHSLDRVEFTRTPLGTRESFVKKLNWTKQFDGLYYVTDGSLFFSAAQHNYLHIQTPLKLNKSSPLERLKLLNWQHINTNSEFTKGVIEQSWKVAVTEVINPLIDLSEHKELSAKKKIILSVGRFFTHLHSKRQDVLIEAFKQLVSNYPKDMKGWKLVLIGSVEDAGYVSKLRKLIGAYPIEIVTDAPRSLLLRYYHDASIFWHAAGFGIDEEKEPEKVEHFGISTVEAMAAGAIPLVHYKGGQKEILGSQLKELGWLTLEECIQKTQKLITSELKRRALHALLLRQAEKFSRSRFENSIERMFTV